MSQEQHVHKELATTKTEITQLSLQLRQYHGERNVCHHLTPTVKGSNHFVGQFLLLKKMSQAKDFEITQLKSQLKDSQSEL